MSLDINVSVCKDFLFLRFKGDLDESNIKNVRERITSYIDLYNIKHLILNFKQLEFIDSTGVGFIIGRYHQLKLKKGDVTLCNLSEKCEKIVKYSGLLKICILRENEEAIRLGAGLTK